MNRFNTDPIGLARELRKNSTPAEKLLWSELRNRKLLGYKFLRQHVIYYDIGVRGEAKYFIPDFYLAEFKLIIELDGKIHTQTQKYDLNRTQILIEKGYTLLRFNNEEVDNVQEVLSRITEKIKELKYSSPR